ncbi:MAG: hypothetical protein AAF416_03120 [Pseudomonadota bacterium]
MRAILAEAEEIATERFGETAVREIPLLVTSVAMGIAHLEAASATGTRSVSETSEDQDESRKGGFDALGS